MADDLRDKIAKVLRERVHGGPWRPLPDGPGAQLFATMHDLADAAMTVVGPEMERLREQIEDERERARQAEEDEFNFEGRAKRAEAAIERVRALAERWENALAVDAPYARALRRTLDTPAPTEGETS